ncbi:MAG: YncE family protein [Thermomicrobiales bacterium]
MIYLNGSSRADHVIGRRRPSRTATILLRRFISTYRSPNRAAGLQRDSNDERFGIMQADSSSHQEMPLSPSDAGETLPTAPAVFSSGVLDQEHGWGRRRLLAVLSTLAPDNHQEINADLLLEQLADSFFGSPLLAVDVAISSAVETTLQLLAQHDDDGTGRPVVGMAIAALEEDRLYLAVTSPCRAALWQDRELLFLPVHSSEETESENALPIPEIRETTLSTGDRLALLASQETASDSAFMSEDALEKAAGSSGSYLWLEVSEEAPALTLPPPADSAEPLPPVPTDQIHASAAFASGPNVRRDLITSSGPRLLQRPPGSDALHRYRSTGRGGTPSAIRSRLPRGAPPLTAVLLVAAAIAIIVAAAYFAAERRPERNYPESATAQEYSQAVAAAIAAEDTDLVNALLPGAHTLLERAGGDESDSDDAVSLRLQIVAANDYLNAVVRLQNPRKVGIIPEDLRDHDPSLLQAAGVLYLLSGDLFSIAVESRQLVALPELIPEQSAGSLMAGGGDISTLALTTEGTSYFFGDAVNGSATVLPNWPAEFGLSHIDATVFRSRLYVIDLDSAEIVVIDPASGETTRWIQRDSDLLPESPIGMAIDGAIHVLYSSGELYTLKEGYVVGRSSLPVQPGITEPAAISFDASSETIYVADGGSDEGRLIAWNSESGNASVFLLGPDVNGRLDGEVHEAYLSMSDLHVSGATGTVTWIADNALWQADLPVFESEEQDASGSPVPEA